MDVKWVKIRAWHAVNFYLVDPDEYVAYCGRHSPITDELVTDLPAEKSCESCLRIIARLNDR